MKTVRLIVSFVVLFAALNAASPAYADDNCGDVKNQLSGAFPVVHWGGCSNLDPVTADAEGALACAQVIGEGAVPKESGHRTVTNWSTITVPFDGTIKVPLPNTYIGYCGGTKVGANHKKLDAAAEAEVKKQIEAGLQKLQPQKN